MESVKGLQKGLHVVLSLLAIVVLASGCQGQATVPNATPTSIGLPAPELGHCSSKLLPGHLLLKGVDLNGVDTIHELTCTPAGTVQDNVIVSISFASVAISSDGRFLGYVVTPDNVISTTFTIGSLDLQTGTKHTYQVSGDDLSYQCVSWSPSGTQVSYVSQGGIIVENLNTGAKRVLVQEPSALYNVGTVFGGIDCGNWISDDILLFHRYVGSMPDTITFGSEGSRVEVPANTTTLAFLRDGTFVDTKGISLSLAVSALSQDGKYVLLTDSKDGSKKLAKVSDFTSFKGIRPISCVGVHCIILGFVPQSDEVFGYQYDPSDLWPFITIKGLEFVDPQSLAVQLGPTGKPANATSKGTLNASEAFLLAPDLVVIQWGGTPDNVIVVYEYSDTSMNQYYYAVSSIPSGEVDWLTDVSLGDLLAWIS